VHWLTIPRTAQRALDAVTESFSPDQGASPRRVRINGAICISVGIVCFAATGMGLWLAPTVPTLLLLPAVLAYAFMIVGSYRLITGKTPTPMHAGEVSLNRVLFGIVSVIAAVSALLGLVAILSYFFEGKG
jgi:hypothetical protein